MFRLRVFSASTSSIPFPLWHSLGTTSVVQKQLTVRSLVVQILSQCRCWTPSSTVTTTSKVQYSMYPVCVLGRHCTLFAWLFVLHRHYFLFAWPCVLVRPASWFPRFVAYILSCLPGFVFLADTGWCLQAVDLVYWICIFGQTVLLAFANLCCSQVLHPVCQVIVVINDLLTLQKLYFLCLFVMMLACTVHHISGLCWYHSMHADCWVNSHYILCL